MFCRHNRELVLCITYRHIKLLCNDPSWFYWFNSVRLFIFRLFSWICCWYSSNDFSILSEACSSFGSNLFKPWFQLIITLIIINCRTYPSFIVWWSPMRIRKKISLDPIKKCFTHLTSINLSTNDLLSNIFNFDQYYSNPHSFQLKSRDD
jgi:hypothetical protein